MERDILNIRTVALFFIIVAMITGCNNPKHNISRINEQLNTVAEADKEENIEFVEFLKSTEKKFISSGKDPFKSPLELGVMEDETKEDGEMSDKIPLKLTGVIKGNGSSVAIIQEEESSYIVKENDKINNYIVENITAKEVILVTSDKERFILKLGGEK